MGSFLKLRWTDFSACDTSRDPAELAPRASAKSSNAQCSCSLPCITSKKSNKTMMSPFPLLFFFSQTLAYVSFFILTPWLTLVTKACCLHTLSPSPVISWSSWCSFPWGPCPSPLHSHPLPPAPALTLPQSSWGMLDTAAPQGPVIWLCKHQLSSDTELTLSRPFTATPTPICPISPNTHLILK